MTEPEFRKEWVKNLAKQNEDDVAPDMLKLMLQDIKVSVERFNRNLAHLNELTDDQAIKVLNYRETVATKIMVYALSYIIANLYYTDEDVRACLMEISRSRENAVEAALSSDWDSLHSIVDAGRGIFITQVFAHH